MVATLVTFVMALLTVGCKIFQIPLLESFVTEGKFYFQWWFLIGFMLSLLPWICMLFISQGAESQPIAMAALRSNIGDRKLYVYSGGIVFISLLGMIFTLDAFFPPKVAFIASMICAGVLLDLLRLSYCRFQFRRTPEGIMEWFAEVTKKSVRRRDETWYTICFSVPFTLMDVYMKCGAYGSLRLFCQGTAEMSSLWIGSLAHLIVFRVPGQFEDSLLDRYTCAETQTIKRISWLLQEACSQGSRPGLEEIIQLTGKVFVAFHNQHPSLGRRLIALLDQASQKDCGKILVHDVEGEVVMALWRIILSLIERAVFKASSEAPVINELLWIIERKLQVLLLIDKNFKTCHLRLPLAEINRVLNRDFYRSFAGRQEIVDELERFTLQFRE